MNKLISIAAIAIASVSTSSIAHAGDHMHKSSSEKQMKKMSSNSFKTLAYTFKAADLNGDGMLSKNEYQQYRMHSWTGNKKESVDLASIAKDYDTLDRGNDGIVSRAEFMNVANNNSMTKMQKKQMAQAAYVPDYYTLTYYLTATPIAADYFDGREVVNVKGDEIGNIKDIVRTKADGDYFAMIDLDGPEFYQPTGPRRDTVGINLDELILSMDDKSVAMIQKGEGELRSMQAPEIKDYEDVDYIFSIS